MLFRKIAVAVLVGGFANSLAIAQEMNQQCAEKAEALILEAQEIESKILELRPSYGEIVEYIRASLDPIRANQAVPSSLSHIKRKALAAQIILVSDIHNQDEYSDFFVSLMSTFHRARKKPVIAIEFISTRHQEFINRYLSNKINIDELRMAIQWEEDPGFYEWKHFSGILVSAKTYGFRVLAAEDNDGTNPLAGRDMEIAKAIRNDFVSQNNHATQYLVFYGGAHLLGKDHLESQLAKQGFKSLVSIVGNLGRALVSVAPIMQTCQAQSLRLLPNVYYYPITDPFHALVIERDYLRDFLKELSEDGNEPRALLIW